MALNSPLLLSSLSMILNHLAGRSSGEPTPLLNSPRSTWLDLKWQGFFDT